MNTLRKSKKLSSYVLKMICKICIHYHFNLHFPPFEICTSDCQYFFPDVLSFFSSAKVCSVAPYLNTFSLHFHFKAYIYQKPYTYRVFHSNCNFWAKCVWQALHFFYFLEALSFWLCTFCNRSPCWKNWNIPRSTASKHFGGEMNFLAFSHNTTAMLKVMNCRFLGMTVYYFA